MKLLKTLGLGTGVLLAGLGSYLGYKKLHDDMSTDQALDDLEYALNDLVDGIKKRAEAAGKAVCAAKKAYDFELRNGLDEEEEEEEVENQDSGSTGAADAESAV